MTADKLWLRVVQINRTLALVAFCGLLLLALMTSLDVLSRWLLNVPLPGVNDISAIMLAVIIAACLPANLAQRQNITVEFLGNALGGRGKAALNAFGSLATLVFISLMAWRFVLYAQEITASGQTTWVLRLPVAPAWWLATGFMLLSIPAQLMVLVFDLKSAFGDGTPPQLSGSDDMPGAPL
jgi:TRAP-type C4-dicarboxylate transport system permease small subunit